MRDETFQAIEEVLTLYNCGVLGATSLVGSFQVNPAMKRLSDALMEEQRLSYATEGRLQLSAKENP